MEISFESNIREWQRFMSDKVAGQVPFATAKALTMTARDDAKPAVEGRMETAFDNPTPFTKRGVATRAATKQTLVATVFIKDIQAKYLKLEETGGVRTPAGRALLIPVNQYRNKYGNMTKSAVKKALANRLTFSGTINGVAGIWKRPSKAGQKRGDPLKLLIRYEDQAIYKPLFKFEQTVRKVAIESFPKNFATAFEQALRTAR